MLRRLTVENFGLIERAEAEFDPGVTIFSGETGSGKTMLVGALAFALGARTAADAVRPATERAIVTLTFDADETLRERLAADGFALDPGEDGTLVRELTQAGKSSLRLNGRPATANYVREIGNEIAEIVGQHEAQRLLGGAYHLALLDRFAGKDAAAARSATSAAYARAASAAEELERIAGQERSAGREYEDARFALDEITAAAPLPGEDERLAGRARYLNNVERVAIGLRTAHDALASDEDGADRALGSASVALGSVAALSDALRAIAGQAAALQSDANELAALVSRELEATGFDATELEDVNARLGELDRLKRKYGGTLAGVLDRAERAREIVEAFDRRDERTAELERDLAQARRVLESAAAALTALRRAAATRLCERVRAEFGDLALASGRFDAGFERLEAIGPEGAERVEFLFSANAGEPARPLARIASGGELSRVLLALVVALAGARGGATLVFDEIDAGIGGATAVAVGARIGRLAGAGQVACVTHLAQLAGWADRHYVLEKDERKGQTRVGLRLVQDDEARAEELARMLSGETHDAALKHARTLLAARKKSARK